MRVFIVCLAALLMLPHMASAVITFTQLDQDIFVISHRVKLFGSRGQAQRLVYKKAASLCVAAQYSYFKILDQESNAGQRYEVANASIRVQLFQEKDEGRVECKRNADPEYIEQASNKLAKIGYQPPPEPTEAVTETGTETGTETATTTDGDTAARSCTVEQITAMVKAGLSEEQIKAACPD